ncbi:ABC transporter ATP-binding protein [Trichothermofontia sp.]
MVQEAAILQLTNVTHQFTPDQAAAVDTVSLMLHPGEILGLLGPSGCGKTTLLRLIAGFEAPQTGRISLAGKTVAGPDIWVAPEHRDVGMVFQDYALFPHLSVAENVAFGLRQSTRRGHPRYRPAEIQQRVRETLALVGLEHLERRYPHTLSGGQQQRVALARALAPQPQLILLDEPLSNLDVQVRLRLRQEVRAILKAAGISSIFVTHDQEEALAISDRVAIMRKGQIEQCGTPEEIYSRPASRFVAEFVTQANFLTARRQGRIWQTEAGIFETPEDAVLPAEVRVPAGAEMTAAELMIRQEDLKVIPDEAGQVVVCDRQFLGREHCYCLQTPSGKKLYARMITGPLLPAGTRVRLTCNTHNLRIFPLASPHRTLALA